MFFSKSSFTSIILLLVLCSCIEQKNRSSDNLYPVDSLIAAQVQLLTNAEATLEKVAEIDGEQETTINTLSDTTQWQRELDIFTALHSINAPINIEKYTIKDGVKDKGSNLLIRSFTTTEDLPVSYLRVFYQENFRNIRRIEALYHEENALLKGSRHLVMEFRDIYDRPTLTSYSVEGSQDMFLSSNVKFSIKGTITIP